MANPQSRFRKGGGTDGRRPDPEHLFGTEEEVGQRGGRGLYGESAPQDAPTSFDQIAPKTGSGQSINRASLQHSGSGDRKQPGRG